MNARQFHPGMGQAVAERTILRRQPDGSFERWEDVAARVARGNTLLCDPHQENVDEEYEEMKKHLKNASILMSGRHLQHGDSDQPNRTMELFTNCSSSSSTFMLFYLLTNGSGVGRCYDDDVILVNYDNAPNMICVLDENHPDFNCSSHNSLREARHRYGDSDRVIWFVVPDHREGWAKAVEIYETMSYEAIHGDKLLVLDFSEIRCKNSPIGGMQGRPASGPDPLMRALEKIATVKNAGMEPWFQAMCVDHYLAECILMGGARRSARMSVKSWRDDSIIGFINAKRPIEYIGKLLGEVTEIRRQINPSSFLWSSNNGILVDEEFWSLLSLTSEDHRYNESIAAHARSVYQAAIESNYGDGTGEPSFINVDKLVQDHRGVDDVLDGEYVKSKSYQVDNSTKNYLRHVAEVIKKKPYCTILNPCGEIAFLMAGAFCVIGDVVPFFCKSLEDAEQAVRATTRALIRTNTMDSVYRNEVRRTNRIGVGLTGIHEFAWKFFGYNFYDLIDETKSQDFWMVLSRLARAVDDEAERYSKIHGLPTPHTNRTVKPSGTVSKLWGLTEGWHLPSMAWYLRWVQFRDNDPLLQAYANAGYPVRELVKYPNTSIVGFPTKLSICDLIPADKIVFAAQATPEQQYQWLKLGEKYWIECDPNNTEMTPKRGNQISYTLKYNPSVVSFDKFSECIKENQPHVRCCSVMPQEDSSSYEYLPEEPISRESYESILARVKTVNVNGLTLNEDIGEEHLSCGTGGCPIDYKQDK